MAKPKSLIIFSEETKEKFRSMLRDNQLNDKEVEIAIDQKSNPEDIQTIVYSVGKENGYEKNLRDWFKLIYQVLFGEEDGPRMGFFVSFFGLKETIGLINDKIK